MSRVLVISDLHEPFSHKRALQHAVKVYKEHKCNKVVFVGDIFDHHRISRHVSEPDSYGAVEEMELACKKIQKWCEAFPVADIVLGNHDRIYERQAKEIGLPRAFLKDLRYIYNLSDKWNFHNRLIIDNVLYLHDSGAGRYSAVNKAREMSMSVVCGHTHSVAGVLYFSNPLQLFFGLNCGCLIDKKAYSMRYTNKEPVLGVGVVYDSTKAIFERMKLK